MTLRFGTRHIVEHSNNLFPILPPHLRMLLRSPAVHLMVGSQTPGPGSVLLTLASPGASTGNISRMNEANNE